MTCQGVLKTVFILDCFDSRERAKGFCREDIFFIDIPLNVTPGVKLMGMCPGVHEFGMKE